MIELRDFSSSVVSADASFAEVIKALDVAALQIVLVSDGPKLIGVITDGDIRRVLLNDEDFSKVNAAKLMNPNFISVYKGALLSEVRHKMSANSIHQIPVLNESGELIGLHHIDEIKEDRVRDFPAVIMAGGLGTRLLPFTEDVPKPMLPVNGQPMIEALVHALRNQGFRQIFISINHLGEKIESHFGDGSRFGVNISYLRESFPMGTAGSLSLLPEMKNSFLVINGDVVTNLNFPKVMKYHEKEDSLVTVCLRGHEVQIPYAVAKSVDYKIVELVEKPNYSFPVNAGIYVLNPQVLERIPSERYDMTELLEELIDEKLSVGAFPMHESWRDIGTPMDYDNVQS